MNLNSISTTAIKANANQIEGHSLVTISFKNKNIHINASMACDNNLKIEIKTQRKILACLGFSQFFINDLYEDL